MEALIALLLSAILGPLGIAGKVERGIETQLRQNLGTVQEVKVEIRRGHRSPFSRQVDLVEITVAGFEAGEASSGGLRIGGGGDLVGKVGKVAIHARDFRVGDLPVAALDITIKDVRYDLWKAIWRRRLEIIRIGDSHAEATLKADSLTRMLAPRIKQLENLRLTFGRDTLTVTGDARVGVRIPVKLTGALTAAGGKIYLVDPKARVSIAPVPSFIVSRLLDEINPLVDLNAGQQGPFELAIDRIRITPREMGIRANLIPRKG